MRRLEVGKFVSIWICERDVLYMGCEWCGINTIDQRRRGIVSSLLSHSMFLNHITTQEEYRHQQGGICLGDMSWSLNFEVWHEMALFVLMCYGHSISSPSLTSPTNTTLGSSYVDFMSWNNDIRWDITNNIRGLVICLVPIDFKSQGWRFVH